MKSKSKSEKEMREEKAPWPRTVKELSGYIGSLVNRPHDYGTCVYAMSLSATAAFQYVAHKLHVTGFQASCADLDVLRRTRCLDGPFIILKAEDMLYPQYDLQKRLQEAMDKWKGWLAKEAEKLLSEKDIKEVHSKVIARWRELAGKDLK